MKHSTVAGSAAWYNAIVFDPGRPPSTPIPAATVILCRARGDDVEVFLLRRHRRSGFMSDAFVFPGGKVDPGDGSPEVAAIRELFEEGGVLLVNEPCDAARRASWRARLNAKEASFAAMLEAERLTPALDRLHYWARWITPSAEPKRFDAQFFLAEAPPDQEPSFDDKETVEQAWLTPGESLARHLEQGFKLPPPQLRTLHEMAPHTPGGLAALVAAARERRAHPHPVMPRFAQVGSSGVALLLPWDPEYESAGVGQGASMPAGHFLATGPSRFLLEGMTWRMTSP